jgi:hypothetical protein
VLLLCQHRTHGGRRQLRTVEIPLHHRHPGGHDDLPTALQTLASRLTAQHADPGDPLAELIADLIRDPGPGVRILAWAVAYDDLLPHPDRLHRVRRVEAVDTDGRVYQLTRLPHEDHGVVAVDEGPDPTNTPATQPGLAALLTATTTPTAQDRPAGTEATA